MLSNQKPCSCILIFLARLPISLGCFSISHPQSCAERPEGPSLPCYTSTTRTCTEAHTLTQAHTASSTPLTSGRMFNKGPFFYPFIFVSPVPPSPPPVSHQPLPFPSHLSSLRDSSPIPPAHTSPQLCHGNAAFS